MRAATAATATAPILILALAGCSADSPDTSEKTASIVSAAFDWDLAFASCMRNAGVDYADPKPGQPAQQTQVDDTGAFEAAHNACDKAVESKRGERPISSADRKEHDEQNAFYEKGADCLRKKGYDIESDDGGWGTEDDIADTDFEQCMPGVHSQDVGGAK